MKYFIAPGVIIEDDVTIGENTKIWYFAHVMSTAKVGRDCIIGEQCFVGKGVMIGDGCKIGNQSQIVEGVILKNNIRIGLGVKFTNVRKPSAKKKGKFLDTIVDDDVTIESNATIQGGVKIGKGAIIGAGAVVIEHIPAGVFVVGNPAKVKKVSHER